jgi:glycosyltransferase involved in cell wall biosynthesis
MDVLFAPDWRGGVPYQRLLGEALSAHGVQVDYLNHYKRLLPLTRLLGEHRLDLFHLHWPEAYYPLKGDRLDLFRRARYGLDLTLATRRIPCVLTAHNLAEHNHQDYPFARTNYAATCRRARLIFAHSATARRRLSETYDVPLEKIRVVPHGDLSVVMPPPVPQAEARRQLKLPEGPIALIFGVVEPYKGQEEVLKYWQRARPDALLVIAGRVHNAEYGAYLRKIAEGLKNVVLHFDWLEDPDLALFLSAADVGLFNYRTIFTSGAASLARSWGLPIVLPRRLDTVDLAEPDPRVFRFTDFESDFDAVLQRALSIPSDFADAAPWRESTSWSRIAEATAAGYRDVLARK